MKRITIAAALAATALMAACSSHDDAANAVSANDTVVLESENAGFEQDTANFGAIDDNAIDADALSNANAADAFGNAR